MSRSDRLGLFNPFRDFGNFAADAYLAWQDLQRNRKELVDAKNGNADKYFHCKGHCEACKEGPGGELLSEILSPGKEVVDFLDKLADSEIQTTADAVDAIEDGIADVRANEMGQAAAERGAHCAGTCIPLAPKNLAPKYAREAVR